MGKLKDRIIDGFFGAAISSALSGIAWQAIFSGMVTVIATVWGYLLHWPPPTLILFGILMLASSLWCANQLAVLVERRKGRALQQNPNDRAPTLALVPVQMEFNPDSDRYFNQRDSPERYREYYCTVFNDSGETLRNVSCELDHIITHMDRPNDHPVDPQTIHEKFVFDLPNFPTRNNFPPQGRERMWLFSRLKKELDNEPIRIVKTSAFFYDRKRKREVVIRVTADRYGPKIFRAELWVQDGILRMTGLRPEN